MGHEIMSVPFFKQKCKTPLIFVSLYFDSNLSMDEMDPTG